MKFKKKLLLSLGVAGALTTAILTPAIIAACSKKPVETKPPQTEGVVDGGGIKEQTPSVENQQLTAKRQEYRQAYANYNAKLKELADLLRDYKQEKAKLKKDDTQGRAESDAKINGLKARVDSELKPLLQSYNTLYSEVKKLEKDTNSDVRTVRIFHTNDEHGRIKFDDGRNLYSGMLRTSEFLADKKHDLLLSAGDLIQGLPLSDSDKGLTISKIAKNAGYDSIAIGNHEFDYGLEHILDLDKKLTTVENNKSTPFISANIYYKDFAHQQDKPQNYDQSKVGKRVFKPYIIKELESGLKVAVFGITTPDTVFTSHPRNSVLVEFRDPLESSKEVIKEIKQQNPDVNFIIATTHLGTARSQAIWTSEYLAQNLGADLDLILDGHSHTYVEVNNKTNTEVYVTQTEAYTKWLGDVELEFNKKTGKITQISQVLRNLYQIEISTMFEPVDENSQNRQLVTELEKSFAVENSKPAFSSSHLLEHVTSVEIDQKPYWIGRIKPTGLGNFASNALAWSFMNEKPWETREGWEVATVDNLVGLTNGGGLRTDLLQGDLTVGDLLAVSPFGNRISVVRVKGSTLKKTLTHGLSKGREGAFSQWSTNVSYNVNAIKQFNKKTQLQEYVWNPVLDSFRVNNKEIDDNKFYYVATNDFILAGGDGYVMLDPTKKENTNVELAYEGTKYLDDLIKYGKHVTNSQNNLDETRFEKTIQQYFEENTRANQVVNIPQEAFTKDYKEPANS